MSCCNCFNDFLVKCNTEIKFFALLTPTTAYKWRISDKFDNVYEGEFTTDADGFWNIVVADLPDGLLTQHSGDFNLTVVDSSGAPVRFKIAQEYDCINFFVKGGSAVKDSIGVDF